MSKKKKKQGAFELDEALMLKAIMQSTVNYGAMRGSMEQSKKKGRKWFRAEASRWLVMTNVLCDAVAPGRGFDMPKDLEEKK